jgi:hypothetical protein
MRRYLANVAGDPMVVDQDTSSNDEHIYGDNYADDIEADDLGEPPEHVLSKRNSADLTVEDFIGLT